MYISDYVCVCARIYKYMYILNYMCIYIYSLCVWHVCSCDLLHAFNPKPGVNRTELQCHFFLANLESYQSGSNMAQL